MVALPTVERVVLKSPVLEPPRLKPIAAVRECQDAVCSREIVNIVANHDIAGLD